MSSSNSWAEFAAIFGNTREAFLDHERAKSELFDGPERAVHIRIAEHGGHIYLDLADEHWRTHSSFLAAHGSNLVVKKSGERAVARVRNRPAPHPGRPASSANVESAKFNLFGLWLTLIIRNVRHCFKPVIHRQSARNSMPEVFRSLRPMRFMNPTNPPLPRKSSPSSLNATRIASCTWRGIRLVAPFGRPRGRFG
jgi:hypothetical protein